MTLKAFKEALKEDQLYMKLVTRINKIEVKDEFMLDELESLHARRDIRALRSEGLLQSSQLIALDNNIDNQSVRSRCVELKIKALRQSVTYTEVIKKLKRYIPVKFNKFLTKQASTVTERKLWVDYVLEPIVSKAERLDHVVHICDVIIEDCDSAGFTLKRINETLEQKSRDK